jgi:hypothetical protein
VPGHIHAGLATLKRKRSCVEVRRFRVYTVVLGLLARLPLALRLLDGDIDDRRRMER